MKTIIVTVPDKDENRLIQVFKKMHLKSKVIAENIPLEKLLVALKSYASGDKQYENEHKEFLESSAIIFGQHYDEEEPDISQMQVKEPNPKFNLNA